MLRHGLRSALLLWAFAAAVAKEDFECDGLELEEVASVLQVSLAVTREGHISASAKSPASRSDSTSVPWHSTLPHWLSVRVAAFSNLGLVRSHAAVQSGLLPFVAILASVLLCAACCCGLCCFRMGRSKRDHSKAGKLPSRTSPLWSQPTLNVAAVPSPNTLAQMLPSITPAGIPPLSTPEERETLQGLLSVCVDQLPADVVETAVGEFDVMRHSAEGVQEVALYAEVRLTGGLRELVLSTSPTFLPVLIRCAPAANSCRLIDGRFSEPCGSLEIFDRDNRSWGAIWPVGSDSYAVIRGSKQVLAIEGIPEAGRLVVVCRQRSGAEPAAHAERVLPPDGGPVRLEVGVRPQLDPVAALACILGVVIFNPEERYPLALPSVGQSWR